MIRALILILVATTASSASAGALTAEQLEACQVMAATLAPKQADIEDLKTRRDDLAVTVETKGEAWEDLEIHRLASDAHALKADAAKKEYTQSKSTLIATDQALQSVVSQYNNDIGDYNRQCVTKK